MPLSPVFDLALCPEESRVYPGYHPWNEGSAQMDMLPGKKEEGRVSTYIAQEHILMDTKVEKPSWGRKLHSKQLFSIS
jgi:hypothetical protein